MTVMRIVMDHEAAPAAESTTCTRGALGYDVTRLDLHSGSCA